MSALEAFELEGRINGLRDALAILVGHLLGSGADELREALEDRLALPDHQEDPGAVPQASFAVAAAATREVELLLEQALSRAQRSARRAPGRNIAAAELLRPSSTEERAMARCDQCGNDYDKTFQVTMADQSYTFDSFECAVQKLAPTCPHCGCRIIGHGVEQGDVIYCCAHCAQQEGASEVRDRA